MLTHGILNSVSFYISFMFCSDYGGWAEPESGELPFKFMTEEHRKIITEKCSHQENPKMPKINFEKLKEGDWALNRVFNVIELSRIHPVMCQWVAEGECDLVACSEWRTNNRGWFCCLDCQEQ